jgi:hypothetical protein
MKDHRPDVRHAASLVERFKGMDAEIEGTVTVPPMPRVVAVIGLCDFVGYTTERDGKTEKYIHRFKAADRPLLCVSPNGEQLLFIGGAYVFTERGIVDLSDTKNLPARYRKR